MLDAPHSHSHLPIDVPYAVDGVVEFLPGFVEVGNSIESYLDHIEVEVFTLQRLYELEQ
jgi:hypothetical protein